MPDALVLDEGPDALNRYLSERLSFGEQQGSIYRFNWFDEDHSWGDVLDSSFEHFTGALVKSQLLEMTEDGGVIGLLDEQALNSCFDVLTLEHALIDLPGHSKAVAAQKVNRTLCGEKTVLILRANDASYQL